MAAAQAPEPATASSATPAQAASAGPEESPNALFVTVGKSVIVNSAPPIERVSVGYGDVAEASAISPHEVLVNGKAPGETSLIVWQEGGGKLFFDLSVQPNRYAAHNNVQIMQRQLSKELPGQKVDVNVEDSMIFLRGTVKDLASSDRAVAIASSMGKVVNLLYVNVPPPDAQILLKVKFASVDRSLTQQLGINLFSTGATNTFGQTTTGQYSPPLSSSGSLTTISPGTRRFTTTDTLSNLLNIFLFRPDLNLGATIEALQTKGLVEVLAEPNVLAQNGKQASFLAGGEFPFPVVQGAGVGGANSITVQFRQFGVRLNFIPTITPRGTIRLQVAPEVSTLDYANGVTISGVTIPGIDIRNVNTEVELSEGQSFALGGLLDNRENETLSKIPWIGDIPILGKLFQSRQLTKNNTELMVIITPQIVHPIPAGKPLPGLKYPISFLPPNTGIDVATPGQNVTGPVPVVPPTPAVPVETLIKSLQPEQSLNTHETNALGSSGTGATSSLTPH